MIASAAPTSATLAASASIGSALTTSPLTSAAGPLSLRDAAVAVGAGLVEQLALDLLDVLGCPSPARGRRSTSLAAMEPIADSTRAAASSTGSSTW